MKRTFVYLIALAWITACASGPKATDTTAPAAKAPEEKKEVTAAAPAKDGKKTADQSATASAGEASPGEIKCSYGSEERAISISTKEGGGCEVNYVRNGESRVIGNANNEVSHCQEIADRVVGNLKNNGFTCQ